MGWRKEMAELRSTETEHGPDDREDWSDEEERSDETGEHVGGIWDARRVVLTTIEKKVLRRRAGWIRVGAVGTALLFPVVFFCALAAGSAVEDMQGMARVGVVALTILLFVATLILFVAPWMIWQLANALRCDLQDGSVCRFVVVTLKAGEPSCLLKRAAQTGLLQPDSSDPQTIDVLTAADWLWRVNGRRPEYWRRKFPAEH
jgi:hypothetical protein